MVVINRSTDAMVAMHRWSLQWVCFAVSLHLFLRPTYLPNHLRWVLLQFKNSPLGAGAALSCCKGWTAPPVLEPSPTISHPYSSPALLSTIAHPYNCDSPTKAHPMQCNGAAPPLPPTPILLSSSSLFWEILPYLEAVCYKPQIAALWQKQGEDWYCVHKTQTRNQKRVTYICQSRKGQLDQKTSPLHLRSKPCQQ